MSLSLFAMFTTRDVAEQTGISVRHLRRVAASVGARKGASGQWDWSQVTNDDIVRSSVPTSRRAKAMAMRAQGHRTADIAAALNVSQRSVQRMLQEGRAPTD